MTERLTLYVLYTQLEKSEFPVIDKDSKLVYVIDSENDTKRIYKITDEDSLELEEIELDIPGMAAQLAEHFDANMLMQEVLKKADTDQLLEVKARLEKPDVSIKSKKGCFSLQIGGKRGRPIELTLIE